MADCTLDDIAYGVKASWKASTALHAYLPPERLYGDEVGEETPLPYGTFDFDDVSAYFGGTEYFSGGPYVKQTKVLFKFYGTHETDWRNFMSAFNDALSWSSSSVGGNWTIPNATVLHAMPEVEARKKTAVRLDGKTVIERSASVTLMLEANRG
jgi:hypothetical protein